MRWLVLCFLQSYVLNIYRVISAVVSNLSCFIQSYIVDSAKQLLSFMNPSLLFGYRDAHTIPLGWKVVLPGACFLV